MQPETRAFEDFRAQVPLTRNGWLAVSQSERNQICSYVDALVVEVERLTAHVAQLIEEKGEAECLLGEYGAGGTPAGLVGGIHNLQSMREKAEAEVERLTAELESKNLGGDKVASESVEEWRKAVSTPIQYLGQTFTSTAGCTCSSGIYTDRGMWFDTSKCPLHGKPTADVSSAPDSKPLEAGKSNPGDGEAASSGGEPTADSDLGALRDALRFYAETGDWLDEGGVYDKALAPERDMGGIASEALPALARVTARIEGGEAYVALLENTAEDLNAEATELSDALGRFEERVREIADQIDTNAAWSGYVARNKLLALLSEQLSLGSEGMGALPTESNASLLECSSGRTDPSQLSTSAWLVERGQKEVQVPTVWVDTKESGSSYGGWTQVANRARRFASKDDADAFIAANLWTWRGPTARATEHVWLTPTQVEAGKSNPRIRDNPASEGESHGSGSGCVPVRPRSGGIPAAETQAGGSNQQGRGSQGAGDVVSERSAGDCGLAVADSAVPDTTGTADSDESVSTAGDERRHPDPASPLETGQGNKQAGDDTVVSESGQFVGVCPFCATSLRAIENERYGYCDVCQRDVRLSSEASS